MIDRPEVAVVRWPDQLLDAKEELSALLEAYHLQTESEKGAAVANASELPDRYRAEVADPQTAFAGDTVLLALCGNDAVGCLVVSGSEIKRLWTNPDARGRGIATTLLDAALAHAAESGVDTVRLSVWRWRTGAVSLYERLGFTVTESWDTRDDLVCMERSARG